MPASTAPANVASDENAKKDWHMQDRRLYSLLLSSLSDESMAETIGCKSSAEVWSALEKDYALQSKTREIQLKDDLQHMRRGSLLVANISSKFRGICDQLASIGSLVPENRQTTLVLSRYWTIFFYFFFAAASSKTYANAFKHYL